MNNYSKINLLLLFLGPAMFFGCSKTGLQSESASVALPVSNPGSNYLTANGGSDLNIFQPANSVTFQSSIQNIAGVPVTYNWTKLSGTGATITSPSTSSTSVTNLTPGIYVFRLTVSDGAAQMAVDDITVTVN